MEPGINSDRLEKNSSTEQKVQRVSRDGLMMCTLCMCRWCIHCYVLYTNPNPFDSRGLITYMIRLRFHICHIIIFTDANSLKIAQSFFFIEHLYLSKNFKFIMFFHFLSLQHVLTRSDATTALSQRRLTDKITLLLGKYRPARF